jgi:MFS superfamily sulfate permease-like transporter
MLTQRSIMVTWFSNVRADIVGGVVSAAVAIPLAMGYGMFAFVSLGESYFASGALAGLYTAFIVAIVCILLGDKTTSVYAPRINSTFFIGLLIYGLVHSEMPTIKSGGVSLILAVTFSIILLAGAFQALFGLIRLGSLIKFAPQPVMAGFQNAAAMLLFLVQLGNVCGFDQTISFAQVPFHAELIKPLSVAIAAVTFLVMWNSRKLFGRVPAVIVGILIGSALYYFCQAVGLGAHLGPIIASDPYSVTGLTPFPHFAGLASSSAFLALAWTILVGALALAVIASFDALLCAKLVMPSGERSAESDKLLLRLGIANMVAPCFGGITGGFNIGPSIANRTFGARTPLAVLVNAAAILIVCTVLFPIASLIPRVALSAVIMVVAVQHFDAWSLRLVHALTTNSAPSRRIAVLDLSVIVLVAVLSVTIDIVLAVFVGIAIAVILFAVSMSRSIIRRSYRCGAVRSRKSRTVKERDLLSARGDAIMVMELQGALFFGTGEKLANEIEAALHRDTCCIILDLRRISEIDSTGALVLREIDALVARQGKLLFLTVVRQSLPFARLKDFGVLEAISSERIFTDVDRAIERAEDAILRGHGITAPADNEIPFGQIALFAGLSDREMEIVSARLARVCYDKSSVVFREGEPGNEILFVTSGTASAYLQLPIGESIRLATFGPGAVFGELALLDQGLRSASVVADGDLICYSLNKSDFAALATEAPSVAIKLLANLGRELSGRLRAANRTIHQLEIS